MHNAAFEALGIDAAYLAFDVPPDGLEDAIVGARALSIRQLAISIPHKQQVMAHLDEVEPTARRIGAVNTVTRVELPGSGAARLVGANTDWRGALAALEREAPLEGRRAVVLGAGGTARALVFGLCERSAEVRVLNRSEERAHALAQEMGAAGAGPLDALSALDYDVLVNTTSVGLGEDRSPVASEALRAGTVVMDVVYEPERTRLLRDAAQAGARTIGGKWMLVHQAALQLSLWTGREAPLDTMAAAFDRTGR